MPRMKQTEVQLLLTCQVTRAGLRPSNDLISQERAYEAATKVVKGSLQIVEAEGRNHCLCEDDILLAVHVSDME